MPTPQDLERLRGLLTQLTQIGEARRGELIRAEDWNALVLAVADIARSVLAADAAVAVPSHDHRDQVTAEWLSPQLRDLLERGPLSDPAVQKRLTEIEQTVRRTRETQDANDKKVEEFRGRLTDVASRDLERQAAITNVRRAVDSVADPRPDLQNMRSTLGVIQRDMTTVLDAASRLSVEGTVIDLGSVVTRLRDLETLRERFRTANGELLDAATIETRIASIATDAVTQDQLDEILRNRPVVVPDSQLEGLETRLGGVLRGQVNGVLDSFRTEVRADVGVRLEGVDSLISTRVNDSMPGLTQSVSGALGPRIDSAQQAATQDAIAAANRSIAAASENTRGFVEGRLSETVAGISTQVQTQIAQRLAADLGNINGAIGDAVRRLDAVVAQANRLDEAQRGQATALAAIPQQMVSLRSELRETVLSEIALQTGILGRSLDERLTALQRSQNDQFQALSREVQATAVDAARNAAIETSRSESRSLRTQLLGEMRAIAREEVAGAIRDQVRGFVNEAVTEQFAAVPGMVAAEVRRVSGSTGPTRGGTGTVSPVLTNPAVITPATPAVTNPSVSTPPVVIRERR